MINSEILRNTPYTLQFLFEGQVFSFYYESTLDGGGGIDSEVIQLKTNGDKITHLMGLTVNSNSEDISLEFIESPTITDGTTPIALNNLNRRSSKTADAQIFNNPTSVSGGSVIDKSVGYGDTATGSKLSSSSASTNKFTEELLKRNTDYAFRVINFDAVDVKYIMRGLIYESGN